MQRVMTKLALILLITGCATFKYTDDEAVIKKARALGFTAVRSSCIVAITEDQANRIPIQEALAEAKVVLTSPNFTLAALDQAIQHLPDPKSRLTDHY